MGLCAGQCRFGCTGYCYRQIRWQANLPCHYRWPANLDIKTWPDDAKGLRISFADVGSTSGWLIPTAWFKAKGIDPKVHFKYSDGATHAANEIAVANGQTDLATDFDRNRTAMIEGGRLDPKATKIIWTSDPLPNDALAVRKGFDAALAKEIQTILVGISEEQAKQICPITTRASSLPATQTTK